MSIFLENAAKIFDIACGDTASENTEFALLVRPDGGLHLIMESPVSVEAAAAYIGAGTAYRVVRSPAGVTVTGQSSDQSVVLEQRRSRHHGKGLMRDQALYSVAPPLLTPASV